jgi:hypothetical protein
MNTFLNIFAEAEGLIDPLKNSGFEGGLPGLLKGLLGLIMYIGVPFIGLILVYAGFKFLFARGKSDQIKSATFNIQWVVIGIGVFLGAWALAVLIDSTIKNIMTG